MLRENNIVGVSLRHLSIPIKCRYRWLRSCVVAIMMACVVSNTFAWSSKSLPLFEPVHQQAIQRVLGKLIDVRQIAALQDQQIVVDRDQQASQSDEHAMTGIETKSDVETTQRNVFIGRSEALVRRDLADAIIQRKAGQPLAAMSSLGKALHALEDATSPSHEGFQVWRYNESWIAIAQHIDHERVYPEDTKYRQRLEGAVRWAYDIYVEQSSLPPRFFDASGNLLLPSRYMPHP